jgi:hypothetical protein
MKRRVAWYRFIVFIILVFLFSIQNILFAPSIYWTTSGHLGTNGIRRTNTEYIKETKLVDSLYPFDVAVDVGGKCCFWTDGYGTIGRVNLDGSNQQTIISDLDKPWGIAIDLRGQKLYWADINLGKIQRANFDGSQVEDVIIGLSGPREIEFNPYERKIYWVENGLGQIKCADLDGNDVEVLVSGLPSGGYGVSGMDLDLVNGAIYWAEGEYTGTIRRANLDGTDITDILTGSQPVSVTIDALGGHLYWTAYTPGVIYRANLDGSDNKRLLFSYHPIGITFVPKPPLLVNIDIKPQSCPNPITVKSKGVLPVVILGTDIFDVNNIDPNSILLEGVAPIRSSLKDVTAPNTDPNECSCTIGYPDGYVDLTLKFNTQEVVDVLGEVFDGEIWMLYLTGILRDDTEIEGSDCIVIKKRGKL